MKTYTEVKKTGRIPIEDLLFYKFPVSMYVETTNICQFKCSYCPMSLPEFSDVVGGYKTMTVNQFSKIAKQIKDGGKLKVLKFWFMGEPLLNKNISEMIRIAKDMDLAERTEVTTNAEFLTPETSKKLIESGLDYLRISISAIDPVRHKELTKRKVNPFVIYKNVKDFVSVRKMLNATTPFLYVKMLNPMIKTESESFLNLYGEIADEICLEEPFNWDDFENKDLIGATYGESNTIDKDSLFPYKKETCPLPFYEMVVRVDGDVNVCCVDWNKGTYLGNAFKTDLKDIWKGPELRLLRKQHLYKQRYLNPSCKNCTKLHTIKDNIDNLPEETKQKILEQFE